MDDTKANVKLSSFFESDRLIKQAVMGNFGDVSDDDKTYQTAKMCSEMLKLPKYDTIKSKLKGAIGVVNFVTNDEYSPLIELLIKNVFPSSANALYNMGLTLPSMDTDGFISPDYFRKNSITGQGQHALEARNKLRDLLLGTTTKVTRKWMADNGFSKAQIEKMLGGATDDQVAQIMEQQAANPGSALSQGTSLGAAVTYYENQMKAISNRYDSEINEINIILHDHSAGKRILSDEDLNQKRKQREFWVSKRQDEISNLNAIVGDQITTDKILYSAGESSRNSDGFITTKNNEYEEQVTKSMTNLANEVKQMKNKGAILKAMADFKIKLENYFTKNPNLQEVKKQFLEIVGDIKDEDFQRLCYNFGGKFSQLQRAFLYFIGQQNNVLILDDFDKSALCIPSDRPKGNSRIEDLTKKVIDDFVGVNSSNLLRDDTSGKRERGNKTLLIISERPIDGLPSGAVVEMDVSPVNTEEASIIVRNILDQYGNEARDNYKLRRRKQLDEEYLSKTNLTDEDKAEYTFAKKNIDNEIEKNKKSLGTVNKNTIKRMINIIVGLGQKEAIYTVRTSIRSGLIEDKDNVINPEIKFNEGVILNNLREEVNKKRSTSVFGVRAIDSEVEFDNYAYKKNSAWGTRVKGLKEFSDELKDLQICIENNEKRISEIQHDISVSNNLPATDTRKLSPTDINNLLKESEGLSRQNNNFALKKYSISRNDIPHTYILYGHPGVGKSIFAHALANVLDLNIKSLDIGASKDKWVGETGKNATKLLSMMANTHDTVYLMDEIDKQLVSGGGQQQHIHETTQDIISKFLEFFDNTENERKFRDNNLFFIFTTNFVENINTALCKRVPEYFEVELPEDPEDYKKFFKSYMNVERSRFPNDPWYIGDTGQTTEEGWISTFNLINSLDWDRISKAFAGKKIDFRQLKLMIGQAIQYHKLWSIKMDRIGRKGVMEGEDIVPQGLPLTTENLIALAEMVSSGANDNREYSLGVSALATQKSQEVKKIMEPYISGQKKIEMQTVKDPLTGRDIQKPLYPKEILEIMNGSAVTKEMEEFKKKYEYKEQVDPSTGRAKVQLIPQKPREQMEELGKGGFEEVPLEELPPEEELIEKQQEGEKVEIKEKDKKKDKVLSSTDYLFKYLMDKGVINKEGQMVNSLEIDKKEIQENLTEEQIFKRNPKAFPDGVYNFGSKSGRGGMGSVMVAPATFETKPQFIKTEQV
jgi:SpoVK/Ycf46/Vps4 family AAA+-type ATPase